MENHKEFHLQRINADIEKYGNPPIFDENITDYFNPKFCTLCVTYNFKFSHEKKFNSLCSMCFFACPGDKQWQSGCLVNFPSFKKLLDAFRKVMRGCLLHADINEKDKNEFLKWWKYRKEIFIKIKEILSKLPDERFTEAGFRFFPEIWGIDNA